MAQVLIAEDEPMVARYMGTVLSKYVSVHVCEDLPGALAYLRRSPDLSVVLSDLTLRRGSGVTLFQWVKRHRPSLLSHVGFVTGGATSHELQDFLRRVQPPCLLKPFSRAEFLTFVSSLLGCPLQAAQRSQDGSEATPQVAAS